MVLFWSLLEPLVLELYASERPGSERPVTYSVQRQWRSHRKVQKGEQHCLIKSEIQHQPIPVLASNSMAKGLLRSQLQP